MLQRISTFYYACVFALFYFIFNSGNAQSIMGRVTDKFNQPMGDVRIALLNIEDSSVIVGTYSDSLGRYRLKANLNGKYYLRASIQTYEPVYVRVTLDSSKMLRQAIQLTQEIKILKAGVVVGKRDPVTQKNDTLEFTSSNYKVNQDATAENLVTKMPGITNENGTIKAQGEEIKKVTVDGQEFFGDDATAALKNLPAEVVDKIQVYDRASDQSQFSGVDDGNSQKTLNIVTKAGKNSGQFGKVYGGYGTDDRWAAGGNINAFLGKHRLSFIGLSNNINQQNFSSQDILGTLGQSANSSGGGMMGRGPGGGGRGGNDMSSFMVNQQNGINVTNSIGFNYTGFAWKKMKVTGSYFYNNGTNNTSSFLNRTYFLTSFNNQLYRQGDTGETKNYSHRVSMRLEYNIDSSNSIIYTPTFRYQNTHSLTLFNALTVSEELDSLNQSGSQTNADNDGINLNHSLLLRHKFKLPGQTISLNLSQTYSNSEGLSILSSNNSYYEPTYSSDVFDQRSSSKSKSNEFSPNLSFTQPISKKSSFELTYNPSWVSRNSNKYTNRQDTFGNYTVVDSLLSSAFLNTTETQKAGLTYRFKASKLSFNLGANVQQTWLKGDRTYPVSSSFSKPFQNILPNAMVTYQASKTRNLRIFYRSRTNLPSVSQLQNVVNNSNPLILSAGNEDLKQELSHNVFVRYSTSNIKKGHTMFVFGNVSTTSNYIGNGNLLAQSDTVINGIDLKKGAQLNIPVNLQGYRTFRTFISYGMPVKKLKSTFNFNVGQSFTRSPALINGVLNISNTSNSNAGVVIASNISERLDFTINYSGNYNIVENSIRSTANSSYLIHNFNAKLNYMPTKRIVFNTDITNSTYSGLGSGFNQSIWLVNGGLGYKFLKDNRGELKISVFDALKKNNSISRTVTESYIEDKTTQILTRFYMLTFTYSIRNFKSAKAVKPEAKPEARSGDKS